MEIGTRTQVKIDLKRCLVTVNGKTIKKPEFKVDPSKDVVTYEGKALSYQQLYYYMLHKPAGVITATEDKEQRTVMELLGECKRSDLFPVGRLDKDTEGLLLITNDGPLAHKLLSPRKHVPKTYLAEIPGALSEEQIKALEEGVDIGDDKPTLPAKVTVLDDTHIQLTISEGRFHQVKRMLLAVGSQVLYLKRVSFGSLTLEDSLEKGSFRELTEEEIKKLRIG